MEYKKLNDFVIKNHIEISRFIGKEINSIDSLIQDVKSNSKKEKKLYEATKDMSKIIDFYDERTKINLNREEYTKNCLARLTKLFPENKLSDYKDIFKVIINRSLEFDESNWNKFYDTILLSTKNPLINADGSESDDINKNAAYSLDYEDLTPKKLVAIFQRNLNDEMIEGGTFSFQSDTQEMMGIVNEFVISKGRKDTRKYLEQGRDKTIKITELLKEVNAASLVEPFSFEDEKPTFKRAAAGQFDGFILQKDSAKLILATKSENTNIENDSIFRHFITAMVIKKRIDETSPSQETIKRKQKDWYDHYTSEENIQLYKKEILLFQRKIKKSKNEKLSLRDYYIDENFYNRIKEEFREAERNGDYKIKISTLNQDGIRILDYDVNNSLFGKAKIKDNGYVTLKMSEFEVILEKMKEVLEYQRIIEDDLKEKAKNKIVSPKFKDQIILDAKKEEMVINAKHLSIKTMISELNQNTKTGLIELGIFKNKDHIDELGFDDINKIKEKAKELKIELIYFGSVSQKQGVIENDYDREFTDNYYKNKEYRYGLNILAYANILSSSLKDNFKITTDASIEFVKIIDLRAITKLKNGQFDLDLEKINKNNFISDVIYVTYKAMYDKKIVEKDSVDFFENFLNATNVILKDFIQDYQVDLEIDINAKIERSFDLTMKQQTGRENESFDLVKTIRSLKENLQENSKKIKNVSLVETIDIRLNEIIKLSNSSEMKKILEDFPLGEDQSNKNARKSRRNYIS